MTQVPKSDQVRQMFVTKSTEYDRYKGKITLDGLHFTDQDKLLRMIFGRNGDFRSFAMHHGLLKAQVEGLWLLCVQMGYLCERLHLIADFGDKDPQTTMQIIKGLEGTKLGQRLRTAYETPPRKVAPDDCDWTELEALNECEFDLIDCHSIEEAHKVLICWLEEAVDYDEAEVENIVNPTAPQQTYGFRFDKTIPEAAGVAVLVIALMINSRDTDQGYYDFLRLAVTAVAAYLAHRAYRLNQTAWLWLLGGIALLYNPVFRVHLDRDDWWPLNVGAAIAFAIYAYVTQRGQAKN